MKTEYTLDLEKWRCGEEKKLRSLGCGEVQMRNFDGFMCCLGQFATQNNVSHFDLLGLSEPHAVAKRIEMEYDRNFVYEKDGVYFNTKMANECIVINDAPRTTIWRKLELLAKRLNREGIRLLVTGDLPL
jgi:hypothetical protein